jgi:hypothetical protein
LGGAARQENFMPSLGVFNDRSRSRVDRHAYVHEEKDLEVIVMPFT